jgi:hypothetical protein
VQGLQLSVLPVGIVPPNPSVMAFCNVLVQFSIAIFVLKVGIEQTM